MSEESDAIVIENVAPIVRKKQVNFTLANCPPGFMLQIKICKCLYDSANYLGIISGITDC